MSLVVAPIPHASKLIDTVAVLTPAILKAAKADGVAGVIAYLGGNLTPQLVEDCRAESMGVVPVNFSRGERWLPSADLGEADAAASLRRLQALGVPLAGLNDWCDVEGCGADPTAYCTSWARVELTSGAGIVPGGYAGAGALMSGQQWYRLPFKGYWHSCSRAIPEPDCGFQMFQLYPPNVAAYGTEVDFNFVCRDFFGRAPTWLIDKP